MLGVAAGAVGAAVRVVRLLGAEVDAGAAHPPELEPAGPAHLVELEIRTVARDSPRSGSRPASRRAGRARRPASPAPRAARPGRPGTASAQRLGGSRRARRLRGPSGSPAGSPERPSGRPAAARCASTKKNWKPASARCSSMPRRMPAARRRGPRLPRAARAGRRTPAASSRCGARPNRRRCSDDADGELEPDALVAREQREEAVRGRRADDLEPARGLERAERGDRGRRSTAWNSSRQPEQPVAPELDQREQVRCRRCRPARPAPRRTPRAAGRRRPPSRATKVGLASWLASTGVKPIVTGAGDRLGRQAAERLEQRQIGVERRFADPVAAVRPAAVVQHVGQVAVQREDEVHRARRSPGAPTGQRAAVDVEVGRDRPLPAEVAGHAPPHDRLPPRPGRRSSRAPGRRPPRTPPGCRRRRGSRSRRPRPYRPGRRRCARSAARRSAAPASG